MNNLDKYRIIGDYEVSVMCLQTYPCKHYIRKRGEEKFGIQLGDDIYWMLKEQGIHDNHFEEYADFARIKYEPTPEEIIQKQLEDEARQKRMEEQNAKWKREADERTKIVNASKASSRLEKLRAKNGVTEEF